MNKVNQKTEAREVNTSECRCGFRSGTCIQDEQKRRREAIMVAQALQFEDHILPQHAFTGELVRIAA